MNEFEDKTKYLGNEKNQENKIARAPLPKGKEVIGIIEERYEIGRAHV